MNPPPALPNFELKPAGCAELDKFDIPSAVKAYIKNMVAHVLKDLKLSEWSDWTRLDIRPGKVSPQAREKHKQSLTTSYPGLLTGPDGVRLKKASWLPSYILSATIPSAQIKLASGRTNVTYLEIVVVLWEATTTPRYAMSFFNNHIDVDTMFSGLAVEDEASEGDSDVGEEENGFALATQFLLETVLGLRKDQEETAAARTRAPAGQRAGASFRVGHQVGTLEQTGRMSKRRFQIIFDDLTPRTEEEYVQKQLAKARAQEKKCNDRSDDDAHSGQGDGKKVLAAPEALATLEARLRLNARSSLHWVSKCRSEMGLAYKSHYSDSDRLVPFDEVCITIIGLPGKLDPEYVLGGIYGLVPPASTWRGADSLVQFFLTTAVASPTVAGRQAPTNAKFYHRDQYIKHGPLLNRLSINYHGDLTLTDDRLGIVPDDQLRRYREDLSTSADQAFRTIPELGVQLALDILLDNHADGLGSVVKPPDTTGAEAYKKAFTDAMRQMHPEISADAAIYPTSTRNDPACLEFNFTPVVVNDGARSIMSQSGAYVHILEYARQQLLAAPPVPNANGLEQLRTGISHLVPTIPPKNITVRDFCKSFPPVVWDSTTSIIAFALPPKCKDHPEGLCLCWVGPFLHAAAQEYDGYDKFFSVSYVLKADRVPKQGKATDAMDVGTCMFVYFPSYANSLSDIPVKGTQPAKADASRKPMRRSGAKRVFRDSEDSCDESSSSDADSDSGAGKTTASPIYGLSQPRGPTVPCPQPAAASGADKGRKRARTPVNDAEEPEDAAVHAAVSEYLLKHKTAQEAKLKTATSAMQRELDQSEDLQKQLQTQLDACKTDYAEVHERYTALKTQHAEVQKRIVERDEKIAALDADLQTSTVEAAKWKEEARKLQDALDEDSTAVEAAKAALSTLVPRKRRRLT
ncbi:hypothetical protein DFH09DRAFT_1367963 [Mycena vulgaris]|nr:hypothetical protein DFH09DRAFT_1367963 [Mycena vulgaris]